LRVQTFPATVQIGPNIVPEWLYLMGFDEAIDRSAAMTTERKSFLKRRLPYWLDWSKHREGLTWTGDQE